MKKSLIILCMMSLQINILHANTGIIPNPVSIKEKPGQLQFTSLGVKTSGFIKAPLQLIDLANSLAPVPKNTFKGDITLTLTMNEKLSIHPEGYKLNIDTDKIAIEATTEKGIFYGLQSLVQMINKLRKASIVVLPCMTIEDYPRFGYRGMSLDVGRHMFPVSFIKQYIDLMSQYKLNTFHWHLTEDQGWRIEIKKYPKLTEISAFRDQTIIGRTRDKIHQYDNTPYGGFYTQDEVREVVAYAASKHITVIPEIEMPGHSLAVLAAYPELACGDNPGPFKPAQRWGIFDDVFCAGKEQTFKFLQDVLDEVMDLFPSEYIHIGGDECPKTKWKTCPHCQARIKKQKLKDEHELQSYFIGRIEKYLNKKGRQIIGWDEILEGGLAPNATVMSWRGVKGGIEAAKQKHGVIMTPNTYLYFDYRQSKSTEEPLNIGGYLPLKTVYSYDPLSDELTPEQHQYIRGVQANIWTEFMKTPEKVLYMVLPRMLALSEIAWSQPACKNWTEFSENRVATHLGWFDRQGLMYRVPEPIGAIDTTLITSSYLVELKVPVQGAGIYYTLDGFTPQEFDHQYREKFNIQIPPGEERTLKTVVITPSRRRSVVVTTVLKNQ
jgi:hexosaminidase